MIFEIIKEISILELIIAGLMTLGFLILIIHIWISLNRKNNIHNSYHKGYNKAKDDKVQYYKTIKEIIDCYDKIFLELTKEGSNNVYKASILELMLNFRKSLQDYYNN